MELSILSSPAVVLHEAGYRFTSQRQKDRLSSIGEYDLNQRGVDRLPIYEYKCNECGGVQEVLHTNMKDVESVKCPNCGSGDLARLMSTVSISMGGTSSKGLTCCGKEERCSTPPCSTGEACRRE